MSSLKELRTRISSVRSTRKITQAMKMVAASKLRRAQERAERARPYAAGMEAMVARLAGTVAPEDAPPLLVGTGSQKVSLLLVITADRGLCGAFNTGVVRAVRRKLAALAEDSVEAKIYCVGRKGYDMLRRTHGGRIVGSRLLPPGRDLPFTEAAAVAEEILGLFADGGFDLCTMHYNRFRSAMSQVVTESRIVPRAAPESEAPKAPTAAPVVGAMHEFEPGEDELLAELLPRNLAVQIHGAFLESAAGEHGARMTAMENATRNAGDMIGRLELSYNRQRQAAITKELIEIISGSEAL
ncbi:MAG: F0F1 ATP synthase subunit gamma [Alphaproteobacteria bacterium]|nr:F0F1 ATP synthase subunit gamma [Alphaproteobacteria bacterium]